MSYVGRYVCRFLHRHITVSGSVLMYIQYFSGADCIFSRVCLENPYIGYHLQIEGIFSAIANALKGKYFLYIDLYILYKYGIIFYR